jgi:hypothetical protein
MTKLWKTLNSGLVSEYDGSPWQIGVWRDTGTDVEELCDRGFHASERIVDANSYVRVQILARVEVDGESSIGDDNQAWQRMRIIDAWTWEKKHSVMMAVFAAELALPIFEKECPDDDRPRKAIEAAKNWLADPTASHASHAFHASHASDESSDAAYASHAASYAAALAARASSHAASSAARATADGSSDAAARANAASYAHGAVYDAHEKIEQYILSEIVPTLQRYRPDKTPDEITYLRDDEVFVFGSNADGSHAGGAARTAVELFGAIEGQGEGLQGQSYAIPTMETKKAMQDAIKRFVKFAKETPEKFYYMTKIGTGIAGRSEKEVAAMFPKRMPKNVIMPKWEE